MALEGTLQDMSLSDLFQIFRLGPKSGVLILTKEVDRGIIYVNQGQLIDAFIVRGAERMVVATRDEAVLAMLEWEDATFVFNHNLSVANRPVRIEHDAEWLIMEGMRRRSDPTRALPYHTITLDTRLQLSPLPSSAESGVSLDVDQWRILSQIASNQTLRSICEATRIEPQKAIRVVAELLSIGLVEIAVPPKSAETRTPREKPVTPPLQPKRVPDLALANAGILDHGEQSRPNVGRGLLNAIMRRIDDL
jgi:hypothetical protein